MAARKGIVTFGLVSIPVELHVAARPARLDFDLLHAKDRSPIHYRLWCAEEDREVGRKEVVKGYKLDGGYVVMDEADFDRAEKATSRAIEVRHFVDMDAVDPVYLERSYWVAPRADTEHAYQVLLEAMRRTRKAAVVTFVMSRRQQYALLRADGARLALHTLYYGDEVRELPADWKTSRPGEREVRFAEEFIDALSRDFTPAEYRDEYRETLRTIIRAKAEGTEPALPEARRPPAKVRNLMDALRRSVEEVRKPLARAEDRRPAGAARPRRHRTAGRRPARRDRKAA